MVPLINWCIDKNERMVEGKIERNTTTETVFPYGPKDIFQCGRPVRTREKVWKKTIFACGRPNRTGRSIIPCGRLKQPARKDPLSRAGRLTRPHGIIDLPVRSR